MKSHQNQSNKSFLGSFIQIAIPCLMLIADLRTCPAADAQSARTHGKTAILSHSEQPAKSLTSKPSLIEIQCEWDKHMKAGIDASTSILHDAEARLEFTKSVKLAEKFGPHDLRLAASLNLLAKTYHDWKGEEMKLSLLNRSLRIVEIASGKEHPKVAPILTDLAIIYTSKGDIQKAQALYERALEINEKYFGPNHQILENDLKSLASIHSRSGDYDSAVPILKRLLASKERRLGESDLQLLSELESLAELHRERGKFAESEPYYRRQLPLREQELLANNGGIDHPKLDWDLLRFASVLEAQGKISEAEPLFQRAAAINLKAYGSHNQHYIDNLYAYKEFLQRVSRDQEASALDKLILESGSKQVLSEHN